MPQVTSPLTAPADMPLIHPSMLAAKVVSGTTYTVLATDIALDFTGSSLCTVTIPTGLPNGFSVTYVVTGTGGATFSAAGGVTLANTLGANTAAAGTSGALVTTSTLNSLRLLNGSPTGTASARTFRGAVADQTAMIATASVVGDWVTRTDVNGSAYELTAAPATAPGNWKAYGAPASSASRVYRGAVADQAAMLAVSGAAVGDWVSRTDQSGIGYELSALPASTLANWKSYASITGASSLPTVTSFNTAVQLDGNRITPSFTVAGALAFTLNATGLAEGGRWTTVVVGNGTNTPTFAGTFIKRGGVTIGNVAGQEYVIQFQRIAGKTYYTVELGELLAANDLYVSDFTPITATQTLQTFTPTSGTWVKQGSSFIPSGDMSTVNTAITPTGHLRGSATTNDAELMYTTGSLTMPATGAVRARAVINAADLPTGQTCGLWLRGANDTQLNGLFAQYNSGGFTIQKRVNGTQTVLASPVAGGSPTLGLDFEMEFRCGPDAQRLYIKLNGASTFTQILTASEPDSGLTAGTQCGVRHSNTSALWTNTSGPGIKKLWFGTEAAV